MNDNLLMWLIVATLLLPFLLFYREEYRVRGQITLLDVFLHAAFLPAIIAGFLVCSALLIIIVPFLLMNEVKIWSRK